MALKQSRARHTKSVGGCQTCKIRRIRCDLNRPWCQRCVSTGRKCDGPRPEHIFVSQHNEPHHGRPGPSQSIRKPPKCLPHFSQPDEIRAFSFYLERAAPLLAGALDEGLWDVLVPQLAQFDTAIKYAVCAISHLFEHPMRNSRQGKLSISPVSTQHLPALMWQARALSADKIPTAFFAISNVLVKIILFSSLEFQQNSFRGGLHLIKLGYDLIAPLLTAGCKPLHDWMSPDDHVVKTVMPICMRSTCLLFTTWDDLDMGNTSQQQLDDFEHNIFRTLCITHASLKDTYLALKSEAYPTIMKLSHKQSELRSLLLSLSRQVQQETAGSAHNSRLHNQTRALQDYCQIGVSWLDLMATHSTTENSDAAMFLSAILEHTKILKSHSKLKYPTATSTTFFQQMTISPPAYLVAIFASTSDLRNEALQIMDCKTVESPNTQITAIVMSLEGEITNTADPQPSFQVYHGSKEESSGIQKLYDIQMQPPKLRLQRIGAGNWSCVAERLVCDSVQEGKLPVACVMGDMNGLYPTRCDLI